MFLYEERLNVPGRRQWMGIMCGMQPNGKDGVSSGVLPHFMGEL